MLFDETKPKGKKWKQEKETRKNWKKEQSQNREIFLPEHHYFSGISIAFPEEGFVRLYQKRTVLTCIHLERRFHNDFLLSAGIDQNPFYL